MKYAWIEENVVCWPVRTQCRVLEVSVSGYFQYHARRKKITTRRHLSQTALLAKFGLWTGRCGERMDGPASGGN